MRRTPKLANVSTLAAGRSVRLALIGALVAVPTLATMASGSATVTAVPVPGTYELWNVACPGATSCLAVGFDSSTSHGVVVPVSSGTPGSAVVVSGTYDLYGIACSSATTCEAVGTGGGDGVVVPVNNGTAGTPVPVSDTFVLYGVACPSATSCIAVGQNSSSQAVVVPITSGTPGTPVLATGASTLKGVSCPSSTTCEAVGINSANTQSVAVAVTSGTPASAVTVSGAQILYGVACPSTTACEAAGANNAGHGTYGVVVPITSGTPGSAVTVSGTYELSGVACLNTTTCEAAGADNSNEGVLVPVTNGTPSSPEPVSGSAWLFGITCAGATSCEAVGYASPPEGVIAQIPMSPVDTTPPTVSVSVLPLGSVASSVALHWSGSDAGSGLKSFDIRSRRAFYSGSFGAWSYPSAWQRTAATKGSLAVAAGYDYCVQARARDNAGNVSAWSAARCVARALDDRALTASTGWSRRTGSGYYLQTYTTGSHVGSTLTRTGVQLDRAGVVATLCASCGTVGVYVGSALVGKVKLTASSTLRKQLLWLPRFSFRSGTVKIKTLTSGKTVQVDGLLTSRT